MSEKTARFPKQLHIIITLVIMFGIGLIPPTGKLTIAGMQLLGITLGIVYGVTFCEIFWPCALGTMAIAAYGIAPIATVFGMGIGSDTIMLCIFTFIFIQVLADNGITEAIATWLATRMQRFFSFGEF